jgi:hypothetical protein
MSRGTVAGGLVLIVVGGWVIAQVVAGNALGRLGISGAPTPAKAPGTTTQAPGPPIDRRVPPGMVTG